MFSKIYLPFQGIKMAILVFSLSKMAILISKYYFELWPLHVLNLNCYFSFQIPLWCFWISAILFRDLFCKVHFNRAFAGLLTYFLGGGGVGVNSMESRYIRISTRVATIFQGSFSRHFQISKCCFPGFSPFPYIHLQGFKRYFPAKKVLCFK